jgi:hypothetical protein
MTRHFDKLVVEVGDVRQKFTEQTAHRNHSRKFGLATARAKFATFGKFCSAVFTDSGSWGNRIVFFHHLQIAVGARTYFLNKNLINGSKMVNGAGEKT